jgi:hypothetical protein
VNVGNADSRKKNKLHLKMADAALMRELWCERCQRYLLPRTVLTCEAGHNMCNRCGYHMSRSLTCTAPTSDARNDVLRGRAEAFIHPCPFEELLAANCRFSRRHDNREHHVTVTHHFDRIGVNANVWLELPLSYIQYQKAVFAWNEMFFILWSMHDGCLSFVVFHVGNEEDSIKYTYDFKIKNGRPHPRFSGCTCHHYLKERSEVFEREGNVELDQELANIRFDGTGARCYFIIDKRHVIDWDEGQRNLDRHTADASNFTPGFRMKSV